ncbi:hypothetical protein [Halalkalibacter oceani]|uniref:Uncharacterized protein n=1 Tax=Halalkalibacter oceani TaxID=1653776 RepID=A0A9X2DSY0_9BACI|nr:hypothetical protein [Halalkalibacter oceani]MCM3714867.1 hypothetical protein [Halalkalibacter oceani]
MISNEEMIIFIKEFYLLLNEYQKCEDEALKKQIHNDILFLSEIIEH